MSKLLKNSVFLTGNIETLNLEEYHFPADHPTCANKTAIRGTMALNTAEEGDTDNIVSVKVFSFEPDEKAKDAVKQNYKVLHNLATNPENNIGRQISVSTKFESNIFQGQDGNLVESVQLGSPWLRQPRPNDVNKAMFTGTVLINKEPVPIENRDGEPEMSENNLPKYRMDVQVFDNYKEIMYPMSVVLEEPGAQWAEGVFENKDIYPVNINIVSQTSETEREIEGAFGTPQIVKTKRTRNERVLYWAALEPLDLEDKEELLEKYGKNYAQLVDKQKNKKALEAEKTKPVAETKPKTTVEEDLSFDW